MTKNDKSLKPFFVLWTGQAVSLLGSQLVQFALIWWLTQTTGSATMLALASLAGMLPNVVLGPFVGVLVDRWNRRLTLMAADAVVALATVVLAYLFWADVVQIWHVFVILFMRALGGSFHRPTMQSSTSLMVPEAQLTRIQGLNQALNGGMNIASAPLGALLLGVLPIQGILAIDVVTALFAIVPLFFIAVPQPKKKPGSPDKTVLLLGRHGSGIALRQRVAGHFGFDGDEHDDQSGALAYFFPHSAAGDGPFWRRRHAAWLFGCGGGSGYCGRWAAAGRLGRL